MEDQNVAEWLRYAEANRRDEKMAQIWVAPLVTWLQQVSAEMKELRVLDYGCGYMDASLALVNRASSISGFDIDASAARIAVRRLREVGGNGQVYERREEIPAEAFDIILVNSVIQYLSGEAELHQLFQFLRQKLSKAPLAKIVVSDILPPTYSSVWDAFRSLEVALRRGCLWAMLRHLYFAATKSSQLKLLMVDLATLRSIAQANELDLQLLPKNLTPSTQRYSVVLRRVDRQVAHDRSDR